MSESFLYNSSEYGLYDNESLFNNTRMIISWELKTTYIALITFLLVIGLPGNLLIVYVVWRYAAMQTTTNLYLMNLAIADLLHLPQIIFVISVILMERFVFGLWLCKLHLTIEATNSLAVTFILTATSFDRYLAVCHPLKSQTIRSPLVAKIVIVVIWIVCSVLLTPLFIYARLTTFDFDNVTNQSISQCMLHFPEYMKLIFTIYSFCLGFAIPVIAICVFYFLVIRKLRHINRTNLSKSKDRRDSVQRIIRMILTLIVVYVMLWFPFWLHQWINHFTRIDQVNNLYLGLITQFLGYLNSSLNPILYAFLSQNFRVMFVQILNCQQNRFFFDTLGGESSILKRNKSVTGPSSTRCKTGGNTNTHTIECGTTAPCCEMGPHCKLMSLNNADKDSTAECDCCTDNANLQNTTTKRNSIVYLETHLE